MTSALRLEAQQLGIADSYADAFGSVTQVSDETLALLVSKLRIPDEPGTLVPPCLIFNEGQPIHIPVFQTTGGFWQVTLEDGQQVSGEIAAGADEIVFPTHLPLGYHHLTARIGEARGESRVIVAPRRAYLPWDAEHPKRVWGVATQLYSLRSGTNWGIGDFTDLSNLALGLGPMGAGLIGVNPLHAIFPDDPERASPYSPSSRQFLNWLYLDVMAIPEYRSCEAAQALVESHEFQHDLARLRAVPLVDYSGVATAKRRVIDIVYAEFRDKHLGRGDTRDRAFSAFRTSQGAPLRRFALFHALREQLGATDWALRDWRNWPDDLRHPERPAVEVFATEHAERVEFYEYLQFLLFEQLAHLRESVARAGMSVGVYGDMAIGVDVAGAEGWGSQDIIAPGLSIGCPPDPLAPHGQNWGLPVFNPVAMKRQGYEPFIRVLRSTMQAFGALRIDHVLGLYRLYCIPIEDPLHGAYLHCPFEDLIRIVMLESHRSKCIVIGEDLGTLPAGLRDVLIAYGLLSYRVLWFEQDPDIFIEPERYPAQALVTISTHDLPTMAGFWAGSDISLRKSLNLMSDNQIAEMRIERENAKAKLAMAMGRAGLLKSEEKPDAMPIAEIHRYVARTPSSLLLVQIEDILGEMDQANMPGTVDEHPNWRRKIKLDIPALLADKAMRQLALIAAEEGRVDRKIVLPPRNTVEPFLAIPAATYRLQFSSAFTLKDATAIIPYLAELGISHVYASSYLAARSGSTHGYDIVDHNAINPEIGNQEDLRVYLNMLNAWRMGQILDFVPNHMGVNRSDNEWWLDVLEWGQESPYAKFFDIDWQVPDPSLRGRVLLPVLADPFGDAVMGGSIKLTFDAQTGSFSLWHGEHRFPVRPSDYAEIIARAEAEELRHFAESFTALMQAGTKRGTRRSQAASLKSDLAQAVVTRPELLPLIVQATETYRGKPDDKESWAPFVALIERQNYRLASWRLAADEINYRRFFDINDLAGVRVEDEELFELMHRMLARLVAQGSLHGVRIDHIDGLHDPQNYLIRLYQYLERFGAPGSVKAKGRDRFYVLVEKILAIDEDLRPSWPVSGETGYEFIAQVTELFVDQRNEDVFTETYRRFTGITQSFDEILAEAKHLVIRDMLPAELTRLARRLKHIADRDWNSRDFSLTRLRLALYEVVRGFRVYRSYVTPKVISAEDRARIGEAVKTAKENWPGPDVEILDFVEKALTGDLLRDEQSSYKRADVYAFAQSFQQYTGPAMAKSLEDTTFYRYYRLTSLNEVGNDPRRFGIGIDDFHGMNAKRLKLSPHTMLGSTTHDTKCGEDTRARINVLSELGSDWAKAVDALRDVARPLRVAGGPTANDEYLIYQTLLGVWPDDQSGWAGLKDRVTQYLTKALREAKLKTSWTHPDEAYEGATLGLATALIDSAEFLKVTAPIANKVVKFGYLNGLSATVLKLTVPGVPDLYQGCDLWNFSLADPDNRRAVDYEARQELMRKAPTLPVILRDAKGPGDLKNGAVKLRLVQTLLTLRREEQEFFEQAGYMPVEVAGPAANHVVAYMRQKDGQSLFVAVGRLLTGMEAPDTPDSSYAWDWKDSGLVLPEGNWRDVLNGGGRSGGKVSVSQLFGAVPVAVWASGI
jgi:(1->4)-alpha-D-glucan 1-alpha-D-glucosylmutase